MRTREEMEQALVGRLQVASNSTLYPASKITQEIKDGYKWASSLFEYPELNRTKYTQTVTAQKDYDYPDEFRIDSVIRVEVSGQEYDKVDYQDFKDYCAKYINHLNTVVGGVDLDIDGCIEPEELSLPTSITIFTDSNSEGNEAVVKKSLSVCIGRSNPNLATKEEAEAKSILANIWSKTNRRKSNSARLDHPFFNVPDFYGSNGIDQTFTLPKYIFADYQRKIFIASFNF